MRFTTGSNIKNHKKQYLQRVFAALLTMVILTATLFGLTGCSTKKNTKTYTTIDDFADATVAIQTGSTSGKIFEEKYPKATVQYYNTGTDCIAAVQQGLADACFQDTAIKQTILKEFPDLMFVETADLVTYEYCFMFPKTEEGKKLRTQMNELLKEIRESGKLAEIELRWTSRAADDPMDLFPFDELTGENGTLKFGTETSAFPFTCVYEGERTGYELEILYLFCEKFGYRADIESTEFSSLLQAVGSIYNIAASGIAYTEDRAKNYYFSDPDFISRNTALVRNPDYKKESSLKEIISSVGYSFWRTFIQESRYTMFLRGIDVTLFITILSVIFGTITGFLLYLLYRKKIRFFVKLIDGVSNFFMKTPVVIILMVLYYVIFPKAGLSGKLVAVITFSLLFANTFVDLLKLGVSAIGNGQFEAGLSLGFSDTRTFFEIIFPQALLHFMPAYKSEVVSLLKATAIVGYIAVQDITKVSDIVRSRTFEAFFPLVMTAVLYFLLANIFTIVLEYVLKKIDPKKRNLECLKKKFEQVSGEEVSK